MLPEKECSLSGLLSQVDSGISRSFDRVKENSCHSKENTCKRLSGISSADSAFSSQDSITLSFEKENTCGKSSLEILQTSLYLVLSCWTVGDVLLWRFLIDGLIFAVNLQTLQRCRSENSATPSGPKTPPS